MTDEQKQSIYEEYSSNSMAKLKQVVYPLFAKFGGLSQMDFDDFLSKANYNLWKLVESYDNTKGIPFDAYLKKCMQNKIKEQKTYGGRDKRTNYLRDKQGNKVKDSDGRDIEIGKVYLDAPTTDEETSSFMDYMASDMDVYQEIIDRIGIISDENVEQLLNDLSDMQKRIVLMKVDGLSDREIKKVLELNKSRYDNDIEEIVTNRHWSILFSKGRTPYKETEEDKMENLSMEIEVTENYRTDKDTMSSLLDDVRRGYIDKNYVSQRVPFQWSDEQVNKYLSRIMNNQPIPEIIICETVENNMKISYLIDGLQRLSYAEEFKEGRIVCKKKGAEFTTIKYRDFVLDENGNKTYDENGKAITTEREFDIIGKKYSEMPEYLQRRFDKFNVSVTRFFNCSQEMIDYHIRNYNNHQSMTKSQYAITNVSNDTVRKVKNLSMNNKFFKNYMNCTAKKKKQGILEEVVARSMNLLYFSNTWKKEMVDALMLIEENGTNEQFKEFGELLDRLNDVCTESARDMFTSTNAHIWFALFERFTGYGIADSKFIQFMEKFKEELTVIKTKKQSDFIDEDTYTIFKSTSTRDTSVVIGKVEALEKLMKDYLHIEETEEVSDEEFIAEVVDVDIDTIQEDMDFYNDSLNDLCKNHIKHDSKLLAEENRLSLLAMIVWSYMHDVDLDEWMEDYSQKNNVYNRNQKSNFYIMRDNFKQYASA